MSVDRVGVPTAKRGFVGKRAYEVMVVRTIRAVSRGLDRAR